MAMSSLDTKSLIEAYLASVVEEGFQITPTQAERDFSAFSFGAVGGSVGAMRLGGQKRQKGKDLLSTSVPDFSAEALGSSAGAVRLEGQKRQKGKGLTSAPVPKSEWELTQRVPRWV
jgi:hypothetical protein